MTVRYAEYYCLLASTRPCPAQRAYRVLGIPLWLHLRGVASKIKRPGASQDLNNDDSGGELVHEPASLGRRVDESEDEQLDEDCEPSTPTSSGLSSLSSEDLVEETGLFADGPHADSAENEIVSGDALH